MTKNNKVLAWILLSFLALIWGSSFILMKKSVEIFSIEQLATIRIFSAFLFFIPVILLNIGKLPSAKQWFYCFLSGLLGNLLPAFCFAFAITKINSSVSGVLNSLTPIFTLIVGALFFSNKISRNQFFGMLLAFSGSVILVLAKSSGFSLDFNAYSFLIVLATIMYGFNLNIIKKYLNDVPPIMLTACVLSSVGIIAGIILFSGNFIEIAQRPEAKIPLIYTLILGIIGSGLATVIFNWVLQITSPVFSSSVTYLIPIVAIFWGIIDGEQLFLQHYVGIVFILLGVFWVNKK